MNARIGGTAAPPCLIINPWSFRASNGRLAARAAALARAYGAEVIEADRARLTDGLDRLLARGQRRIFVLGGDGTVRAFVDQLARLPAGLPRPQLLLLAGGRTNLTAADLGGGGAVLKKLESALRRCRGDGAFHVEERHLLAVEQAPAPPRHGFFAAAGLIDSAIRECHRHRNAGSGALRTGRLSTAWCLLKLAIPGALERSSLSFRDLDVQAPGCGRLGQTRLLIATTLLHRDGLFNPYAERGSGAVRVTAVAARAPFWRALPRLLTGRFTARMSFERGYLSGRFERIEVLGLSRYTLDGEKFDADPTRPVAIGTGPRIGFLTP